MQLSHFSVTNVFILIRITVHQQAYSYIIDHFWHIKKFDIIRFMNNKSYFRRKYEGQSYDQNVLRTFIYFMIPLHEKKRTSISYIVIN